MGWLTPKPNKADNFVTGRKTKKKVERRKVKIPQARKMGMAVPKDWDDRDEVTIETTVDEKGNVSFRIV